MTLLTITVAVDNADLDAFTKDDPDLTGSFAARLQEVYGDNGAMLTTGRVRSVIVGEETSDDDCNHSSIVCTHCGSHTDF